MADQQQLQLSFTVGGERPSKALLVTSGRVFVHRELAKGEEIHLQVVDADGELVADGYGKVTGISFKDKLDKDTGDVIETERVHHVKVS